MYGNDYMTITMMRLNPLLSASSFLTLSETDKLLGIVEGLNPLLSASSFLTPLFIYTGGEEAGLSQSAIKRVFIPHYLWPYDIMELL